MKGMKNLGGFPRIPKPPLQTTNRPLKNHATVAFIFPHFVERSNKNYWACARAQGLADDQPAEDSFLGCQWRDARV